MHNHPVTLRVPPLLEKEGRKSYPLLRLPPRRLLRSHSSSGRLPPPRLLRSHSSSGRLPPPRLLRSHPSSGRLPPPRLLRSHPSSGRRGRFSSPLLFQGGVARERRGGQVAPPFITSKIACTISSVDRAPGSMWPTLRSPRNDARPRVALIGIVAAAASLAHARRRSARPSPPARNAASSGTSTSSIVFA